MRLMSNNKVSLFHNTKFRVSEGFVTLLQLTVAEAFSPPSCLAAWAQVAGDQGQVPAGTDRSPHLGACRGWQQMWAVRHRELLGDESRQLG